jgi:hypothetical protein
LNQRTWVHFGKAVGKRIFHSDRVAKSGAKVATLYGMR